MIRCLLQSSSISTVNHASRPLRTQDRPCHKKAFLAVCWLIVEPPRSLRPCRLRSTALPIASRSKPQWLQKREFSAAIAARAMSRSIAGSGELQVGSNIGRRQVKAADYFIGPDLGNKNEKGGGF